MTLNKYFYELCGIKRQIFKFLAILGVITLQIIIMGSLMYKSVPGGDEIFTYTLANNPYSYDFIDYTWKYIPNNNGWIDGDIIKSNYTLEPYNCFNYSGVYWHQRIDVHPLFYNFLVHTLCSFIPSYFQFNIAQIVNLFFLIGIDILLLLIFKYLLGNEKYAVVPIWMMTFMPVFFRLFALQRMYAMLAFFALWYLWLNIRLISEDSWKKKYLIEMIAVIVCGTQVHYYFYVYAAGVSIVLTFHLIRKKKIYELFHYFISGFMGFFLSLIIFPWMIWHVFFNSQQKHTSIIPWDISKVRRYFEEINNHIFNQHFEVFVVIILFFLFIDWRGKRNRVKGDKVAIDKNIWLLLGFSSMFYSLVIFTLDDVNWYYMTCLYIPCVIMIVIYFLKNLLFLGNKGIALACILAIGITGVMNLYSAEQNVLKIYNAYSTFRSSILKYTEADCIYIEERQNNLLSNRFFELGEHNEIKKIDIENYKLYGIDDEIIEGRENANGDIILYLPEGVEVIENITGEYDISFLAEFSGTCCYVISCSEMIIN